MMRTSRLLSTAGLIILMLLAAFSLQAQETGQIILKRGPIDRDFYAAGQDVHLLGPVNGDVTIVGQRLTIDGAVTGDVMGAGESVTINGDVLDDIRAVGRQVQINGTVGDHMVAAGETVTIGPSAKVGSWAWLAGRQIEVLGKVGKELKVAGQEVIIAGEVGGPVTITAERVKILGDAVIHGPLRVKSPNAPEIAKGAKILGDVKYLPMPEVEHAPLAKVALLAGLMFTLGLILTGIVYYLLFPRFSVTSARNIGKVPLPSLGLGFLVLLLTPLLIFILFSVGVGFLLGILLAAAYLLMVVSGGLTSVIYVSDVVLRRLFKKPEAGKGVTILVLLAVFVLVALVQLIPLLGSLVVFVLSVMGIGALQYQFWQQYKAT
ncbi:MAG: hypothetical protein P8Z75_14730 [Gammaproteobacteria bacterium]